MVEILIGSVISSFLLGFLVLMSLYEKNNKYISSLNIFQSLTTALLFFVVVFVFDLYLSDYQDKGKSHVYVDSLKWVSDGDYENVDIGDFSSSDPAGFSFHNDTTLDEIEEMKKNGKWDEE